MELKLYDTLRGGKPEPFEPRSRRGVGMYVCGPTVYDFAHIGNARPLIVFDVLFRLLSHLAKLGEWDNGEGKTTVTYVRNITDVDDKINERSAQRGITIRDLTEETYANFKKDVASLGCLPPTVEPRATEHIDEMKTLIELLLKSNHAYIEHDHVLFNVRKAQGYGRLSKRSLEEMIAGARVEIAPYKRDPMDFVLWKPSKPGEPSWPSPGGIAMEGRPGWHIECSAMAWKYLGKAFDIHGGGIDLVFPHHENELAQSCCAFDKKEMANFWMHNGFLQVEHQKMSKSLGNFITIRDLLRRKRFGGRKWSGSVLRAAMLQTHYRQPIDWTVLLLEQTEARLERWRNFAAERTVRRLNQTLMDSFVGAIANDLNTPEAFSILDEAINSGTATDEDRYTVYKILKFLGLKTKKTRVATVAEQFQALIGKLGTFTQNDWDNFSATIADRPNFKSGNVKPEGKLFASMKALADVWSKVGTKIPADSWPSSLELLKDKLVESARPAEDDFEAQIRRLVSDRDDARKARDFAKSDLIRDQLLAMGVVLKDTKDGTTWEIAG